MNITSECNQRVAQDSAPFQRPTGRPPAAKLGAALVALVLVLGVSCTKTGSNLATADQDFMLAAAQGGMAEVKLGELAAQKGTRDDVKAFGQLMVKDHTAINGDLKALAAQKNVTLPGAMDAEHQAMVDKMVPLAGAEFDDAYIAGMISDHQEDVKAFKAEADATKDADIKSFVEKSLPVLTGHLERITAMKK